MFKEVDDFFNWMVSFTNLEQKPDLTKREYRLDRMFKLLEIFNNPHIGYKIIHVAGSKGKGSTSGFLAAILSEAGYKTGVYSSPHLLDYRERITLNHTFFDDNCYLKTGNLIKERLSEFDLNSLPGGEPTTFELMTLAAFMIFKNSGCEWVVLETGLGGRIDSTNVVLPEASVITPIELEHQDLLGDTIEEIAGEKAGIIKDNRPVFTSNSVNSVLEVLQNRANEKLSLLQKLDNNFETTVDHRGTILYTNNKEYSLGLHGEIQGENALLAIKTLQYLIPEISEESILNGLKKCRIPGRFQQCENNIVIDGAHTEKSVKNAAATFNKIYGEGTLIFGALNGKNVEGMATVLKEFFHSVIISTPGTFKESSPEDVERIFSNIGFNTTLIKNPGDALKIAKSIRMPILVTGSFYMAGEIGKVIDG